MAAPGLQGLFQDEAAIREAGGDRPLLLGGGKVWLVRSGRIDVFATQVRDGEPVGHRAHLFRVEAGSPLFAGGPHPDAGLALLAVGTTGTTLAELELEYVRALAGFGEFQRPVAELLDAWVRHLYEGIADPSRLRNDQALGPGEEVAAGAGVPVRPVEEVAWVEQAEGRSRLVGADGVELRAGELLPVSDRGWLEAVEPSVFRAGGAEQLLARGDDLPWEALDRLHRLSLALISAQLREAERAQRKRLAQQQSAGQAALSSAVSRLAGTMDPVVPRSGMRLRPAEEGAGADDALFAAFRLVAEAQGIDVGPVPEDRKATRTGNPLEALARTYRVRTRRVALREGWWTGDSGPLLGLRAEDRRPVALLPVSGGYELCDPGARTQARVDAAAAETLGPFGYSLYRPFPATPLRPWQVMRHGFQGCGRDLLGVAGTAMAMGALAMVTPLAIGVLFDAIIPGAERGQLLQLTLVLLVAALATGIFQVVRGVALLRIESRAGTAIQAAVWDRLIALPLRFFRDFTAGDLAVRAMGIEEMRRVLSGAVVTGLLNGVLSVFYFALLFYYDGALGLLGMGLIAGAIVVSFAVSYLQLRRQREIFRIRSRTSGVVLQLLTGIAKLKMVGAESQAFGLWARLFSDQRKLQFRARSLKNWLTVFNAAYPVACSVAIFWAAAPRLEGDDPLTTGAFLGFLTAFTLCLAATLSASSAVISVLSALPLYEQAKPILHASPEVDPGKTHPGDLSGGIELQHVSFRYLADGPPVLRDVSFRVRPGEFVALVGPSGSGKSTILRLLLGFETPEVGTVAYDEQDLAGLDIEAVRRQLGVVLQSGKLMAGDIFTNIVGSSIATLDDAWEAARMAGLEDDIRQMPMGMNTVVSEGGSTFSGGQRQRLMIARAVVHHPRILLFDEATSALDNRTQAIVTESLDRLKATRIVVAHRLSTILNADRIYVMQAGSIVETGSYQELLDRGGVFAEMARRQLV